MSACADNDWHISNFNLQSEQQLVRIDIDQFNIRNDLSLNNIKVICPGALSVYPQLLCEKGTVEFKYLQHEYIFNIDLQYDFQGGAWVFDIQSLDQIIEIHGDSTNPNEISLQLQGYDLSQLSKDYADLEVQLPEGLLDIKARVNLAEDSIIFDYYRLNGLSWESVDGQYIFADMGLVGEGQVNLKEDFTLQLQGQFTQGESLLGQIYTDYANIPLKFESISRLGDQLQTDLTFVLKDVFEMHAVVSSQDFTTIDTLQSHFSILDLEELNQLALSQALDAYGFVETDLSGQLSGMLKFKDKHFEEISAEFTGFHMLNDQRKLSVSDLNGKIHWSPEVSQKSQLSWENVLLAGTPLGYTSLEFDFFADQMRFQPQIDVPVFDGSIHLKNLHLEQLFSSDIGVSLEAEVRPISLRQVTEKMGWPLMAGNISGYIPGMRKNGQVIEFDGTLNIQAFSGQMQVNNLSMERLFGIAPVIAADLDFADFNLQELTDTLDFGEITGLLYGSIQNLRITNWQADRMQGVIYTQKKRGFKQTISQKALDRISSLGGIKGAISSSFLRFFSNFRYKKIALSCELVDAVCQIGGIEEKNGGFVIVQGGGIPEINIMGFQQRINWHEFVDRLLNANYSN
ncbi:hypothetical protein [Marinicella sp. W31]|uniref:hypothetical protein n=1 Tax=Marinicella sp. W31 TaxID=3023713 RepID=UPI0037566312